LEQFTVRTNQRMEMVDITDQVNSLLSKSGAKEGLCIVYIPHTTCGVTVNEGADPAVARDILEHLARLVPKTGPYHHREGNADSHILTTLVGSSQAFVVQGGKVRLGTWQRIFLCEFDGPRTRTVWVKLIGA